MTWSRNIELVNHNSKGQGMRVDEQLIKDVCTLEEIQSNEQNISNSYQNDEYTLQQLFNKIDDKSTLENIKELIKRTSTNDKANFYLNKIAQINNKIQKKLDIAYKVFTQEEIDEKVKPLQDSYEFFFWTNELNDGIKTANEAMYQDFQKFDTKITQLLSQHLSTDQLAEYLETASHSKGPSL